MEELVLIFIRSLVETIEMIATVVIPFEFLLLAFHKKSLLPDDVHVNFFCGACVFLFFKLVDGSLPAQALYFLENYAIFNIEVTAVTALIYILIGDLCFYAWHRLAHTSLLFMLDHSLHHSSSELNYTTNLRVSILVWFYSWVILIVPVFLGFNPVILLACFALSNSVPFFLHNEHTGKLGWLEIIFNTPSHHRVHHGKNTCYINKNFGGMLIIWDRLFHTYAEEREPVEFGVVGFSPTRNPVKAISCGWLFTYKKYGKIWKKLLS